MNKLVCIWMLFVAFCANASSTNTVTLAWCPSADANVIAYKIHYGTGNVPNWVGDMYDTNSPPCPGVIIARGTNWFRSYSTSVNVGNVQTVQIAGLVSEQQYFFTATALNTAGFESDYCNEVKYVVPPDVIIEPPDTNGLPSKVENFRVMQVK